MKNFSGVVCLEEYKGNVKGFSYKGSNYSWERHDQVHKHPSVLQLKPWDTNITE